MFSKPHGSVQVQQKKEWRPLRMRFLSPTNFVIPFSFSVYGQNSYGVYRTYCTKKACKMQARKSVFVAVNLVKSLIVPHDKLGLYLLDRFDNYTDNDEQARTSDNQRLDIGDGLQYVREYSDNTQKKCASQDDTV